ncbi:MAG: DMT family transporter [Maritimibacter sp.]
MKSLTPTTSGILLYITAVFLMSVMDLTAKALSAELPVLEVVWARYMGQTVVVTLIVLPRIRQVARTNYPGLQFLRSLFVLGATSMFFFGVSQMGLAETTAIMDVNPVLITLGAALFLGEKLGPRRLIGIGAALLGAMIIIRPGSAVFSPFALLPMGAAICYSGFALVTRHVGQGETVWTSLFYTALLGAAVLSVAVVPIWVTPSPKALALMVMIGFIAASGQFLLIRAFTLAEASTVAPFSYVGLLFATLWGAIFFGNFPDRATLIGAAIVVVAGIYVWHRETREARRQAA